MFNFITWTVNPNLIDSFVTVRWYGIAFAIGFWIGYEIVSRMFKHEGAPESWVGSLFVYVVAGTIIGSRLGHVFFYEWDYYSNHLSEILKIWEGGLAKVRVFPAPILTGTPILLLIFTARTVMKSSMSLILLSFMVKKASSIE